MQSHPQPTNPRAPNAKFKRSTYTSPTISYTESARQGCRKLRLNLFDFEGLKQNQTHQHFGEINLHVHLAERFLRPCVIFPLQSHADLAQPVLKLQVGVTQVAQGGHELVKEGVMQ